MTAPVLCSRTDLGLEDDSPFMALRFLRRDTGLAHPFPSVTMGGSSAQGALEFKTP